MPRRRPNVGYTTMTGDMLHAGHINFLRTASSLCDRLIVGLTTDDLATVQKREPWFSFSHRKSVVSSLRFVHAVVEHRGQSKMEAHAQMKFNSLFIGDDYRGDDEYLEFEKKRPCVKVYFLPRTSGVSTTDIVAGVENRVLSRINLVASGVSGQVMHVALDRGPMVVKPICLGYRESTATEGQDVYGISVPQPRNWKCDDDHGGVGGIPEFPMISGVNGHREILVGECLRHLPWNPYLKHELKLVDRDPNIAKGVDGVDAVVHERKRPSMTYWLYQRDCGVTLDVYLEGLVSSGASLEHTRHVFFGICTKIRAMIRDIQRLGVVHGDLHPGNVCIGDSGSSVTLIDFGWCLSTKFQMSTAEREYFDECLLGNFDWSHFRGSLGRCGLDTYLPDRKSVV